MQRSRGQKDRQKQRLVIIAGFALLMIIGGIVGYGYYSEFVAPPRVLAARVGDTVYTQGDLVKRVRLLQAASVAVGQPFNYGRVPFEVLEDMAEAEIIRRAAPTFGVQVTDAEVEGYLLQVFYPRIPAGQEVLPGQIEQEFKDNYQSFLNQTHLSDRDYREITEENIYRVRVREVLGEQVPLAGEQVKVHWIILPPVSYSTEGFPTSATPDQIYGRLETEEFAAVAGDVSVARRFANEGGYVGWVPEGAFPFLDDILFGNEETEPLAHDEISPLILSEGQTYIIKVTAGPEEREISETMRSELKTQTLENWLQEQKLVGGREGWFELKFNSQIYEWVTEQVRQTAPRVTPPADG